MKDKGRITQLKISILFNKRKLFCSLALSIYLASIPTTLKCIPEVLRFEELFLSNMPLNVSLSAYNGLSIFQRLISFLSL